MVTTPQREIQLTLFQDDDEVLFWSRCERYKRLTETQQRLVRSYCKALQLQGGKLTKQDWIEASGMPRSTAYEVLSRDGAEIDAAIAEALQVSGHKQARFGALALPEAGRRILRQILDGRDTRTLTAVEYNIMRDCSLLSGLMQRSAGMSASVTVTDAQGVAVTATVSSDEGGIMAHVAKLRERVRGTDAGGIASGGADSVRSEVIDVDAVAGAEAAGRPALPGGEAAAGLPGGAEGISGGGGAETGRLPRQGADLAGHPAVALPSDARLATAAMAGDGATGGGGIGAAAGSGRVA